MSINAKQKGNRGERALRDVFRDAGYTARRTVQFCGTAGDSDVIVDELPMLHVECKNTSRRNFPEWMEQANRDCKGTKIPLVCHKESRGDWTAILSLANLLDIIRRSDLTIRKEPTT